MLRCSETISCASTLPALDRGLQGATSPKQHNFRGMSVIALGDFYQLQPCTPPALYSSLMDIVSGTREVGRPGYQQVGTNLFSGFKLFELKTQMRAREDSEHGSWVEAFRSGNMKPVDRAFIELLKSRQFSRMMYSKTDLGLGQPLESQVTWKREQ